MKKLATLAIVAALSLAALTGCGGGGGTSGTPVTAAVKMDDAFKFDPATLSANKGDKLTVTLDNSKGTMTHDFTITALKVSKSVEPGKTAEVVIPTDKAGTYEYFCTQPGHKDGGMQGKLTIK